MVYNITTTSRSKCLCLLLKWTGPRDVESLKAFVLDEAEKAAAKAQLGYDKDLWAVVR